MKIKSLLVLLTGSIYSFMLFVSSNCNGASYPQKTTAALTVDLSMNQYKLTDAGDIITKGPWVDVRAYASFSAAIDNIGASYKTLLIPNTQTVSANKTVPTNVHLLFLEGGSLSINAGVTVTINGPIDAPIVQIFSGSGTVSFGSGFIKEIYVEWFGAKGDGSTDNFSVLQSVFAAVPSTGAAIIFPSGNYFFSDDLTNLNGKSNVTLIGYNATLTSTNAAAYGAYALQFMGTQISRINRIRIFGLTFTMNRVRDTLVTNTAMIAFEYADDVIIEDVKVLRHDVYPIIFSPGGLSTGVRIRNCQFGSFVENYGDSQDQLGHGIHCTADDVLIEGNFFGNIYDNAIAVTPAANAPRLRSVVITENRFRQIRIGSAIFLEGVNGTSITGNTIYRTGNSAIFLAEEPSFQGSINFTISGNAIVDAAQNDTTGTGDLDGIAISGSSHRSITGNLIRNPKQNGIQIVKNSGAGTDVNISSNTIVGDADGAGNPGSQGIYIINISRSNIGENSVFNFRNGILIINTSASNILGVNVTKNILANIGQSGGAGIYRAIYFSHSGAGIIKESYVNDNIIYDTRVPVVTTSSISVDSGDIVTIGRFNVSSIPNDLQGGTALITRAAGVVSASGTTETDLRSMTIYANTFGGVTITAFGDTGGTAGTKTIRLKWGTTTIGTITFTAAERGYWQLRATILPRTTGLQSILAVGEIQDLATGSKVLKEVNMVDDAIDTTVNVTLKTTGQLGNAADSLRQLGWLVERF